MCGAETPYEFETHIDERIGYIEGVGQTCLTGCITASTILQTPNDYELGSLVRKLFYKNYKP
jgi:predicted 2-oxoglutarate/Fe(II)-dependent dioxygenase YbiX